MSRLSLESIIYAFHRGESREAIRQSFSSISLEQIYGAITHYLANKDTVDSYLVETERQCEEFAREHPLPTALRQKLEGSRRNLLAKGS